jgi:Ribbon-helix-helix protein, copG family
MVSAGSNATQEDTMQRINIETMGEDDYSNPARKLVGWFNVDAAEEFAEDRAVYDGANLASVHTRDQNRGQTLYRTAGGRWVLHRWSRWQGEGDWYEFIGADAAREWLLVNGDDDDIERLFGAPPEPERGPGRPEIGPMVNVRMIPGMIARLDEEAAKRGESRAEIIRRMVVYGLATTPNGAPAGTGITD